MQLVLKSVLFINTVAYTFSSFDSTKQPPLGRSKFDGVILTEQRCGYLPGQVPDTIPRARVNTVQIQTDPALQDDVSVKWPSGVVRYYVDERTYDNIFAVMLESATKIIQRSSCVQFIRMNDISSDNMSWIHITNPRKERECNHEPRFMDSGEIELVFGYDCLKTKDVLHTLLHGIGIKDEVTHPHRDKYIRVLWDNIQPAYRHLYRKQEEGTSKTVVEYDPLSVMQFHDRAFSRNGRATIEPLETGLLIAPSEMLSQLDQMRLQMYFEHECNKRKVSNLLKTCEKSLKEVEGKESGFNKLQDANISNSDYSTENSKGKTINKENLSSQKEISFSEDREQESSVEQVMESKALVGEIEENESVDKDKEDAEGQDVEEQYEEGAEGQYEEGVEGQDVEDQNEEDPNGRGVDGQDEDVQDKEEQNEEGKEEERLYGTVKEKENEGAIKSADNNLSNSEFASESNETENIVRWGFT